jgi:hypothetical protein
MVSLRERKDQPLPTVAQEKGESNGKSFSAFNSVSSEDKSNSGRTLAAIIVFILCILFLTIINGNTTLLNITSPVSDGNQKNVVEKCETEQVHAEPTKQRPLSAAECRNVFGPKVCE